MTRSVALAAAIALACVACSQDRGGSSRATEAPATVPPALSLAIGLPVYPGAVPVQGGGVTARSGTLTVVAAYYRTVDSLAKVELYYETRLPKRVKKDYIKATNGGLANFLLVDGAVRRQVTLTTDADGTVIGLSATSPRSR